MGLCDAVFTLYLAGSYGYPLYRVPQQKLSIFWPEGPLGPHTEYPVGQTVRQADCLMCQIRQTEGVGEGQGGWGRAAQPGL